MRGRARVLAVNSSWRLAPWADALYACDGAWWRLNNGVPEFEGLKITADVGAARAYGLRRVDLARGEERIIFEPRGRLGWAGNSGFHAVNLAAQFGASHIILVGFDMHLAAGAHWHGPHPKGMNNPDQTTIRRWRRVLDGAADDLEDHGIEVLNASAGSALEAYRKIDLSDAFTGEPMPARSERLVRFLREFRWSPPEDGGRTTLRFDAGKTYFVRAACARAAIAVGAAKIAQEQGA